MYSYIFRINGQTKYFHLYYDGLHYVGRKRFQTVDELVADGLTYFYIESYAQEMLASLSGANFVKPELQTSNGNTTNNDKHDKSCSSCSEHQVAGTERKKEVKVILQRQETDEFGYGLLSSVTRSFDHSSDSGRCFSIRRSKIIEVKIRRSCRTSSCLV